MDPIDDASMRPQNPLPYDFLSQTDPVPSSQDGMFGLDLNSSAALDFPHMGSYQEILELAPVEDGSSGGRGARGTRGVIGSRGGSGGRGGTGAAAGIGSRGGRGGVGGSAASRGGRGGRGDVAGRGGRAGAVPRATSGKGPVSVEGSSNGPMPFRAPRTARAPNNGGRGGSRSEVATTVPSSAAAVGGSSSSHRGPPQFEVPVGMTEEIGAIGDGLEGAGIEEEDETLGNNFSMGNRFDKANWSAENTSIFCDICLEEKRAGNHSNGFITNRGYVNMAEKYYISTHLKHSRKQLRNRWDQLKGLYQFWLYLNGHIGLGRNANGSVMADDDFWDRHTKNKPDWRRLRTGPPDNLAHLEEIFEHVAVDGSSACIPGEIIGDGNYESEEDHEEDGMEDSPMSVSTRKRGSSTTTTAMSPTKKTKSPMVKVLKGILDNFKEESSGEKMAKSMKKALQLAVESGAAEDSIEYFMATTLFVKAENREAFFNFTTKEARLIWLKRWCTMKKLY